VASEGRGFEEFHPVRGTPLAYSHKYTPLAYKVNCERGSVASLTSS